MPLVIGLVLASAPFGSAWAQVDDEFEFERPTEDAIVEMFAETTSTLDQGRKTVAADMLLEIIEDPEQRNFHAEAYARLGRILLDLDLPYAALISLEKALAIDPEGIATSTVTAIELADSVGDTALLEEVFAQNLGLDVDAATRSRMAYLAAREAQRNGNYGTALAILTMVRDSDPFFPEAMALYGVVLTLQGRATDAIDPFQTALRVGEENGKDDRFRNIVTMNLARAYFTSENFPRAIENYAMVDRESRQWPEAEFERAWAHFRLNDMNGTIGLLQDHSGPFFADAYFPEAYLLRIYSLILMCKFTEAHEEIDLFKERYEPQLALLTTAATLTPTEFFSQMRLHEENQRHRLPPMVTWLFESEDRFNDGLTAVRHAEDEMNRLRNISANPFSLAAMNWVRDRRDTIIEQEGARMRGRVGLMVDELDQMIADSEMSKLDIMSMESSLYEMASVTGEMPEAQRRVRRSVRVRPGYREWPFEGEYWADEAGYYRANAVPECPESLRMGGSNPE